jgi:hypothetical protein
MVTALLYAFNLIFSYFFIGTATIHIAVMRVIVTYPKKIFQAVLIPLAMELQKTNLKPVNYPN